MSELAPLISDLALILICAGVMTLVFKRLKQPLVLGYIVAGFLASPHVPLTPSVIDVANIHTWSEIGVIFLLFALGLEFSFKKLVKVGGTAVIAACTIIFCMILVGIFVGWSFGWQRMDCLYLGGMLAMSSTTIIYKAFDDLGLRQQRFAGLVLSILILEDILAIVLMVMLSTMAVSQNFEGSEMVYSIAKLLFFLILWFVVGIYIIPTFLKRSRKWMANETLLIVSLALCFGMVVVAAKVGFSAAFGAFIMGSILAETVEAENIEKLVAPVKDLFGAIFFVSVGMMVDPAMIVEYIWPIVIITLAILLGQVIFGTGGVILSGQPLKVAMQCGFSLTQIGEFAFIIASLGVSLKVTSDFLYPIVVAVSVITTFLTPYMIRLAIPAYHIVEKRLPGKWKKMLERYSSGSQTVNHENNWKKLLVAIARIVAVYSVLCIAMITLSFHFIIPLFRASLPVFWANLAGTVFTIVCIAPFLRAIIMKKNHSVEFQALWQDSRFNRAPLISTILLRIVIAVMFVMFVIEKLFQTSTTLLIVGYMCRIPIAFDGTCSGLQHYSAMLLDPIGGNAVNLTSGHEKPEDIYQQVADGVIKLVEQDALTGTIDETKIAKNKYKSKEDDPEEVELTVSGTRTLAQAWLAHGITRKVCKRPVMTLAYGSGEYGFSEQLFEDIVRNSPHFKGIARPASKYLAKQIAKVVKDVVVSAVTGMAFLKKLAIKMNEADIAVSWWTPLGLPVQQNYLSIEKKYVQTRLGAQKRVRIYWDEPTEKEAVDKNHQRNGVAPNFIHSLDSTHLMMVVNEAGLNNYTTIHDSFGTSLGETLVLKRVLREQLYKLYTEYKPLESFKEYVEQELDTELPDIEIPKKGTLDLSEILMSEYVFH